MIWPMYCDARNYWRASDEKEGPLSEKNLFERPYREITLCSFLLMESADLEEVWYLKGYLQKISAMRRYSMVVSEEEVSCKVLPWGIWYISGDHRLDCLLGLMLSANLALINIIWASRWWSGRGVSPCLCFCGCCRDH